jgi:hypothetical protein
MVLAAMRRAPRAVAILALTAVASCERRDDARAAVPATALVLRESLLTEGSASEPARPPVVVQSSRDSMRGTIILEGTGEAPRALLMLKDGRRLSVAGAYTIDVLRQLEGLEIVAYGRPRRHVDEVNIETFSVRGRAGEPARDGILRSTPSGHALELADGRRLALPHLPNYVASAIGERIWIAGPLEAPTAAGVIDPDRRFGRRKLIPEVH